MNTYILNKLKNTPEMDPDKHDASYELMRSIIDSYAKSDETLWDYNDLNAVYLMSVGTWRQGIESKKSIIDKTHLPESEKKHMKDLLDHVWERAIKGVYENKENGSIGVGMFGTGFFSFQKKTDDVSVKAFIRMCIDISTMQDDNDIFERAEKVLNKSFRGMGQASASMILHCLKPFTFPILNSNMGNKSIFEALDIKVDNKEGVESYIPNCRRIKAFRDENLPFKNYRIMDMAAWELGGKVDDVIKHIIEKYKENFKEQDKEERYKWQAVKHFLDNWDIDAGDFPVMLKKSLDKAYNLLNDGYNFAAGVIVYFSEKEPETVRNMFKRLFNEDDDILDRIKDFIAESDAMLEKYRTEKVRRHYQNARRICVYLFFRFPDKYYMFQPEKFRAFAEKIGYNNVPKSGSLHRVTAYMDMCNQVLAVIKKDNELLEMSRERLDETCYKDENYHALADDVVYFGSKMDELYWPPLSQYDPEISKDEWSSLIKNQQVFTQSSLTIMERFLDMGGEATCKQLSQKYGETVNYYNAGCSSLAKRVYDATGCNLIEEESDEVKWWPILFTGRNTKGSEDGTWIWKLRQELKQALEKTLMEVIPTMATYSKNMILYGPPGTGKTYHTVSYAVAIIEEKAIEEVLSEDYYEVFSRYRRYKEEGLVEFTTFHQSFGYEEFIEGIRPVMSSGEEDEGNISYSVSDGIFKEFCQRAGAPVIKKDNNFGFSEYPTIWKVSLMGTGDNPVRKDCMKNGYIRIGWDEYGETVNDETEYKFGGSTVLNAFINRMQKGDIVLSCYSERTIDAIGVVDGDYQWRPEFKDYCRVRKVRWLIKGINEDIVQMNQGHVFTLSTVYRANIAVDDVIKILNKHGVANEVSEEPQKNHVFIIDEINRGNISKIFGELITLIEPSKRLGQKEAMRVRLPYSRKPFGVPDNVYIIGTMNTADRSIALIDTALRRRFTFIEMQPDISVLQGINVDGVEISNLLGKMNRRIEVLYDREHTIGHAYFMPLKTNPTLAVLADIFEHRIIPLLQEYFFEDYEKIRLVLGDNHKSPEEQFIRVIKEDYRELFGDAYYDSDETPSYEINTSALKNINTYAKL